MKHKDKKKTIIKKLLILMPILTLLISCANAQSQTYSYGESAHVDGGIENSFSEHIDFYHGIPFGTSSEQVIEVLGTPVNTIQLRDNDVNIYYSIDLYGEDSYILLHFEDNMLTMTYYAIGNGRFIENINLISEDIYNKLTIAYGKHHEEIFYYLRNTPYHYLIWHFDNFHVYFQSPQNIHVLELLHPGLGAAGFGISFFSNDKWEEWEEDFENNSTIRRIYQ